LRYANVTQPLRELPEPQKMDHQLVAVRTNNNMANVGSSRHCLCNLLSAICQGTLRDMPKSGKLTPSLSKIHWIWRTCFYIDGCATVRTVALKWQIFKQKKGCAAICWGLNYCSMGSSQPPSRDTLISTLKNARNPNPSKGFRLRKTTLSSLAWWEIAPLCY
jgi:hypothetical protein